MSFADADPLLRTLVFAGILAGAAVLCWWALTALGAGALAGSPTTRASRRCLPSAPGFR